jgi:hypothetical protein
MKVKEWYNGGMQLRWPEARGFFAKVFELFSGFVLNKTLLKKVTVLERFGSGDALPLPQAFTGGS